jgi:hypothetical protein
MPRTPLLTSDGICRILAWHENRRAFKARHGSIRSLAAQQGLSVSQVVRSLKALSSHPTRDSMPGRDALTTQQQRALALWLKAFQEFSGSQLSAEQLAAELGVSRWVIFDCARRAGRYASRLKPENPDSRRPQQDLVDLSSEERGRLLTHWPVLSPFTSVGLDRPTHSDTRARRFRGGSK